MEKWMRKMEKRMRSIYHQRQELDGRRAARAAGGGGQRSNYEERRVSRSRLEMGILGIFSTPVDRRGLK
jgi:hypothetical protein